MSKKNLKNFSTFLSENWMDKTEEFIDDVQEETNQESDDHEEHIENLESEHLDELEPIPASTDLEEVGTKKSENHLDTEEIEEEDDNIDDDFMGNDNSVCCKIVFLHGIVSTMGSENPSSLLTTKLKEDLKGECKDVFLYQLNIQPSSENGVEPMDGMVQVYENIKDADVVIVCSDLKKGQISSVLQVTMERLSNHFKHKELRNKVFASVITGQEESYQNIKANLLNFANNMGMIIGGDCHLFCGIEDGQSLADCGHDFETNVHTTAICIEELSHATENIRMEIKETPAAMDVIEPFKTSSVLNFDDFDNMEDTEDHVEDIQHEESGEEPLEDEETDEELSDEVSEEEEDYFYDYVNDIPYNRTEYPFSKPNPIVHHNESKNNCGKKGCGKCKCKSTNESKLLNFDTFLNKKK